MSVLQAAKLSSGYGSRTILSGLDLSLLPGKITAIIGPNGSGKSTLLKALCGTLKPAGGTVLLDGREINGYGAKELARKLAVVHQSPTIPGDLRVRELIGYGRFPHHGWLGTNTEQDSEIIAQAIQQTGLNGLEDRMMAELSGGERQRAWIAMALAQQAPLLALDEPTTYLDVCHQLEVLELLHNLNAQQNRTIIMVLHDINHAARYADEVIVLNKGEIAAAGTPQSVITTAILRDVFKVETTIYHNAGGYPVCVIERLASHSVQ